MNCVCVCTPVVYLYYQLHESSVPHYHSNIVLISLFYDDNNVLCLHTCGLSRPPTPSFFSSLSSFVSLWRRSKQHIIYVKISQPVYVIHCLLLHLSCLPRSSSFLFCSSPLSNAGLRMYCSSSHLFSSHFNLVTCTSIVT